MESLADTILRRIRVRPEIDPSVGDNLINRFLSPAELRRMAATVSLIPRAEFPGAHLIDIGGTIFWLPLYLDLGYTHITVIARPEGAWFEQFDILGRDRDFTLNISETDAELDPYPFDSGSVQCVVCFALLEHFAGDPMHCIAETNRILAPGGSLCLSTPNVINYCNVANMLLGAHPFGWSAFTDSYADRHNREYTPFEVRWLLEAGGFAVEELSTVTHAKQDWKYRALGLIFCAPLALAGYVSLAFRESVIMARARQVGSVKERYPAFLYDLFGQSSVKLKVRTNGR
jgi:SAM-dependent methyltransferase